MAEQLPSTADKARSMSRAEKAWLLVAVGAILLGATAGMLTYVLDPMTMVLITIGSFVIAGTIGLVGITRSERRSHKPRRRWGWRHDARGDHSRGEILMAGEDSITTESNTPRRTA